MKTTRKALTLIMALALILSLAVPAFATAPAAADSTYTLTINNSASGHTYEAYQIFSGNLELHHGVSAIPVWGFIPVDDYFALLQDYYGGIPTGEYDVTLFFNGQKVWSVPFTVNE